ncbi:hypothetical protein TCAL_02608 [Tigriopus californicus]|uniref:Histone acetyltransferase n=1 Tax=Tigriopus californicus TaxID=6832 RepID=A0A553NCT2_TIGCA|nr:uncharacterized protein LOC131889228 [Tigriopus californicus]TRY63254.1 hypothetical protein TCAL_02608 [Tigriopus californicus]|eukprot:TCALIF_02608-PA protein Name:"Similar to KAT6A Histone acetyltransferase KAT6A (Homo sapiens)" AED:0.02 eAED:0.02 QI:365/1/1/1/1/1/6/547/1099
MEPLRAPPALPVARKSSPSMEEDRSQAMLPNRPLGETELNRAAPPAEDLSGLVAKKTFPTPLKIPRPLLPGLGYHSIQSPMNAPAHPNVTHMLDTSPANNLEDLNRTTPVQVPSQATNGTANEAGEEEEDVEEEEDDEEEEEEIDDDEDANQVGVPLDPATIQAMDVRLEAEALLNALELDDPNADMKPVSDSKLERALVGQEPTTRNLIMAAIGVMKNRKARPDTKRICNWIHRRYGQPYMSIYEELERLVKIGELARVDYKGSASYRIVDMNAKTSKRRKRTPKATKTTQSGAQAVSGLTSPGGIPPPLNGASPCSSSSSSSIGSFPTSGTTSTSNASSAGPPKILAPNLFSSLTPHQNFLGNNTTSTSAGVLPGATPSNAGVMGPSLCMLPPPPPPPPTAPSTSVPTCVSVGMTSSMLPSTPFSSSQPTTTSSTSSVTKAAEEATANRAGNAGNRGQNSISLRTLVHDFLGNDVKDSYQVNFTSAFIRKAVQNSQRNFNKLSVLANLDMLLQQELDVGNFTKIAPSTYVLAPLVGSPVGTIQQYPLPTQPEKIDPSAMFLSPTKPACIPQNLSDKSDEQRKNDLIQETLSKLTSGKDSSKGKSPGRRPSLNPPIKEPVYLTLREKRLAGMAARKNAAIQGEKLSNLNKITPLPEVSSGPVKAGSKPGRKPGRVKKGDKRLQQAKLKSLNMTGSEDPSAPPAKKRKKQRDAWKIKQDDVGSKAFEIPDEDGKGPNSPDVSGSANPSRPGSLRKKKSRKIFDPADHEQPSRKRKFSTLQDRDTVLEDDTHVVPQEPFVAPSPVDIIPNEPSKVKEEVQETCYLCKGTSAKNKRGTPEALLHCRDCTTIVHPSCMDYTENLTKTILASSWQCINCKTCSICEDASEDESMLFCDSCDLGFHMPCLRPPMTSKPSGKWDCYKCQPRREDVIEMPPPPTTGTLRMRRSHSTNSNSSDQDLAHIPSSGIVNGHRRRGPKSSHDGTNGFTNHLDGETAKLLPLLPPHLHPSKGLVPCNWEDFPVDPQIPDVGEWNCQKIEDFFLKQGFPSTHASVFVREEIDGRSLLLLNRQDCLNSLGLKMGPALKLFHQIKKLQTRRNFPH